MRRSKLNLKVIFKITQAVITEKPLSSRGRPRTYSDALIIAIFLYQILRNLSYREVLEEASFVFGQAPALSTYHYRVSKLPKKLIKEILKRLAQKLLSKEGKVNFLIADGTGFSYLDLYPLRFFRGLEVRRVKAHIRVVPVIVVTASGKRVVLTAETGGSYASEVKLLTEALGDIEPAAFQGAHLIADRCYDSIDIIRKLRKLKIRPAIRVKETFRKGVRHPLRKRSKVLWEGFGRNRYLIESLFGTVKLKMGSHFRVKREEIAQKMGLGVFALYNMYLWVTLFVLLSPFQVLRLSPDFSNSFTPFAFLSIGNSRH